MPANFTIIHELPDRYHHQAASLYYEAFQQQLEPIFRSRVKANTILSQCFNADRVIAAVSENGLVGFVGYQQHGRQFIGLGIDAFIKHYGLLTGWIKFILCMVFVHEAPKRHMLLDGLVVHPLMRNAGIGTQLLQEISDYALQQGFIAIRLEVADINHEAKRLYLRLGFEEVSRQRIPFFLRPLFGFSSYTTMVKELISFKSID